MCVSGITGSDLRARIESIMANRAGRRLSAVGCVVLAVAAASTLGGPIGLGLLHAAAQSSNAPSVSRILFITIDTFRCELDGDSLCPSLVALAREVGELRLAIAPQAALSIAEEGPELGSHVRVIDRFSRDAPLAVAVFTSPGCALCRALEPSLRLIASDPEVELEVFDEQDDAEAWLELAIPGSPYAVVLSPDGDVLAKGTFNSLFQLESILATATRPVSA